MKHKILYMALGLGALLSAAGCDDKAFLEEKPETIYTVDNAFSKSSQVDAQVARTYFAAYDLYVYVSSNIMGAFGGNAASTLFGYGSDVLESNGASSGFGSAFSNFANLDALNGRFLNLWNALYQLASYANLAIYGADQVSWSSEADKANLVAQAKFFLGWSYLRLAECFGGVPLVEQFNQDLRYDYIRESRENVYAFAIKCLSEAVDGLPDYPAQDGRVAKGVANHFLAEAYIAQGIETGDKSNYTKAIAAAQTTVNLHPLMTKRFGVRANPEDTKTTGMFNIPNYVADGNAYYDLFQMGNYDRSEGNTEGLWVMETPSYEQYSANSGTRNNNAFGCAQPYRDLQWAKAYKEASSGAGPWSSDSNIDLEKYPYGASGPYCGGGSWGMYGSTDYIDEYIWQDKFATDDRNSQIVLIDPVCMDQNHSMYGKIVDKNMLLEPSRYMRVSCKVSLPDAWGWDPHCIMQSPQYMFGRDNYAARSAETYLLLAEAQFRNGDAASAAASINQIRKRANCSYMFTAADVSIESILDERARELSWEEHRWPTLLRMAKQGEDNTVMHNQLMAHAMYVHDNPMYTGGTPKWSLFPIPLTVIQLNSEATIEQNKGWN
ncbi:MAG: RagB/SusD family nutrient uptake outer membrane protein [Bacteroidales bacterium]|nr:RagB/SusD family nutrient uptake outer membrane protein [Bacteroidales bacterium]